MDRKVNIRSKSDRVGVDEAEYLMHRIKGLTPLPVSHQHVCRCVPENW